MNLTSPFVWNMRFHAEQPYTSAEHALFLGMFFTLNRFTLQLNMLGYLEHVFHAEPLRTSAKHALALGMFFTLNCFTLQLNMR